MKLRRALAASAATAVIAPAALLAIPPAYASDGSETATAGTSSLERTQSTAEEESASGAPGESTDESADPDGTEDSSTVTTEEEDGSSGSTASGEEEQAGAEEEEGEGEDGAAGDSEEADDRDTGGSTDEGDTDSSADGGDAGSSADGEATDDSADEEVTDGSADEEDTGGSADDGAEEAGEDSGGKAGESTDEDDEGLLQECENGEINEDPQLLTTLNGLPSKVVAGSGFHTFTYRLRNDSENTYERVDFGVFAGTVAFEESELARDYLTLEFKNPDTGGWEAISTDFEDEEVGYIGYTEVLPNEVIELDLRLIVDSRAPKGLGYAVTIGAYADHEGNCFLSTGDYCEFDVIPAGSDAGKVPDSKPQGGNKPLPPKPVGDKKINPEGTLAETGADSALPVFALAGAAAVALGTGAVFVLRRRRNGAGPDTTAAA